MTAVPAAPQTAAATRAADTLPPCGAGLGHQPERRVPVGDQDERVGGDPVVPPEYAFDEAEYAIGVMSRASASR